MLTELIALTALIAAVSGVAMYWRDRRHVFSIARSMQDIVRNPTSLGSALRHAYPPEDVAGIIDAVVTSQRPAVKQFIVDEGIPFLAAAGSKEVAANARGGKSALASAVGDLGSGAAGLQGLASIIAKPGKSSGVGELVQYLPMIQQFMQNSRSQGSGDNGAPPQSANVVEGNYHVGGKLGGN